MGMRNEPMAWYGVRTFHRWVSWENSPYEERVVLFRARSLDEAVELGEREAAEYAGEGGFEVLDLVQAYRITDDADEGVGAGTEVFSLLHAPDLPTGGFLERYDPGPAATDSAPAE
ncbi:hypothetical protein [Streptomyces sp. NPDC001809]